MANTERREKQISVIYLSVKCDIQSKIKGLKIGAEDYLTKPFEVLELLVRAEKVLKRNDHNKNIYQIDGVTINEKEHTVLLNGDSVEFKPMEYSLLLMLVKHPNMVFSREQLLHEVWGDNYFGETRTVDNHIAILRKKLISFLKLTSGMIKFLKNRSEKMVILRQTLVS